ncbi:hypothetical protein BDC45DRAFT_68725 [Circinella umbellata]|nr:hypothetical protein BDC45DRAFT_68725 [Circinella umbellata]
MPVLQEFCEQVIHAYNTRHGEKFCELFAFEDQSPIVIALRREMSTMSEIQCEHLIENNLETISNALSEFVISYIKLLNNSINYSLTHVYDFFQAFYNSSIPVFSSADSNYLLPFIKNLSTTLVVFAFHVDKMENLAIKKMKANGAARLLSKVFNIMLADR